MSNRDYTKDTRHFSDNSFYKDYPNRKDHRNGLSWPRKHDPRHYDSSCRNHRGCAWCSRSRQRWRDLAKLLDKEAKQIDQTIDPIYLRVKE